MTSAIPKNSPGLGRAKATRRRYQELVKLRDDLTRRLRAISAEALRESERTGNDLTDAGTEDAIRDTELTLLGEEGKRLASVQEALRSIEEGTYGICIDCGKQISPSRLDAIPYAKLCVDCKALREANDGLSPREMDEEEGP